MLPPPCYAASASGCHAMLDAADTIFLLAFCRCFFAFSLFTLRCHAIRLMLRRHAACAYAYASFATYSIAAADGAALMPPSISLFICFRYAAPCCARSYAARMRSMPRSSAQRSAERARACRGAASDNIICRFRAAMRHIFCAALTMPRAQQRRYARALRALPAMMS